MEETKWQLSKEDYKRIKDETMEKVIDEHFADTTKEQKLGLALFFEDFLNHIMPVERRIFLKGNDDSGNGSYNRVLSSVIGKLNLSVPRTRNASFRSSFLPDKYKRTTSEYDELLFSLFANGYSDSKISKTLKRLNLPYSEDDMEELKNTIKEKITDFKTKQLPDEALCLIIDAYHTQIRHNSRVKDACVYSIIMLNMEGKKELAGFYIFFGKENTTDWVSIFNDLITRGLKRVLIIVSDDFPGISERITSLFPNTDHQLCYVHLQRNIRRNLSKQDAYFFREQLKKIVNSSTEFEEAKELLFKLCESFEKKYPNFIKKIKQNIENYIVFKKYPKNSQKYIYTSNAAENINKLLEDKRFSLGGYFQSLDVLEINFFLMYENLLLGAWKHPAPLLASCVYEFRQLANIRFGKDPLTQYS